MTKSSGGASNVATEASRREILRGGLAVAATGPLLIGAGPWHSAGYRIVETRQGKLRGRVRAGVLEFKGIRYGESTAAENRFLPPRPVRPWRGARDALQLGNQSPQSNPDFPAWLDSSAQSEDCLFLNVWAPAEASPSSSLPVMVWFHGGGFRFGSGWSQLYNGEGLARDGKVVVVTINHRLNIFGYTYLGTPADERFSSSGNVGNLDLVAGLGWVRDNIGEFGGDPTNVTIFGESGGGGKVTSVLGMPLARGMFHKAIVESGSLLGALDRDQALEDTMLVYRALGIREGDIAALQRVPTQALLKCFDRLSKDTSPPQTRRRGFGPVADGKVIFDQIWERSAPNAAHDIPMIIGTNLHEGVGFIGWDIHKVPDDDRSIAETIARIPVTVPLRPEQLAPLVREFRRRLAPTSAAELLIRVSTDVYFWRNAILQAERKIAAGGAPVYVYECDWRTPCWGGMYAPHGVEVPFVFNVHRYGVAWDGKDTETLRDAADPQGRRFRVENQMMQAWVNFARTGNPSSSDLAWPAYDISTRSTMVFDGRSRVVNDLRSNLRPLVMAAVGG